MNCKSCGAHVMFDGYGTARELDTGRLHSCPNRFIVDDSLDENLNWRGPTDSLRDQRFADRLVNIDQPPAPLSMAMEGYAYQGIRELENYANAA